MMIELMINISLSDQTVEGFWSLAGCRHHQEYDVILQQCRVNNTKLF